MKNHVPLALQANRIRTGQYASDESFGLAGAFRLIAPGGALLIATSSGPKSERNTTGWEQVTVAAETRAPTAPEMAYIKDLFWSDDECVMQLYPPRSERVESHPYCLRLWRPIEMTIPVPPLMLFGPKPR